MPHFFIILLKINLVLILFAAAYYLILRRLTFYVINRMFLAFGILFGTIYPFIDLTDFFHRQSPKVAALVPEMKQLVPTSFIGQYWQWIALLFYVGVFFMAIRLLIQFISLYSMHKKSAPGSVANFEVRILDEPVGPFSFWQTVYINPSLHQEKELKTILEHEQIHVKQWHSLDIILAELSVVFYWFNPGVWLMKKAVKENLEFITDEKILKKGVDKKAYQYSLLDVGNLVPAVEIVNNFNLSDLKKRIQMMNAKRSSKLTLSRYLLVLPVLLLTTLAFTVSKKDIKKHLSPIKEVLIAAKIIEAPKVEEAIVLTPGKKHIAKKKNEKVQVINIKIDTPRKYQIIINSINLRADSLETALPEVEVQGFKGMAVRQGVALPEALKGKVEGKMFFIKSDSVTRANSIKSVENIKFSYKSDEPSANDNKNTKETVVVTGYAMGTKLSDRPVANAKFYLNGKEISNEELKNLNADDIKNVSIKAAGKVSEIHVFGRAKVNP